MLHIWTIFECFSPSSWCRSIIKNHNRQTILQMGGRKKLLNSISSKSSNQTHLVRELSMSWGNSLFINIYIVHMRQCSSICEVNCYESKK